MASVGSKGSKQPLGRIRVDLCRYLLTLVLVSAILYKPIVRLGLMEAPNLRQGKICWASWGSLTPSSEQGLCTSLIGP